MTNEEAIVCVKMMFAFWENTHGLNVAEMEAAKDLVIERLKNPTANIDREAWEPCEWCEEYGDSRYKLYAGYCMQKSADDFYENETEKLNYCPMCGRPLTEEAWAMLEKRLRG